jgi:hypothetical protein
VTPAEKAMGKTQQSNPRADRLRAALRENLKRRKEQARQRADTGKEPASEPTPRPNSGGIGDDEHES